MATEYELFEPPNDGISAVVFHPSKPEMLMVSSWDKVQPPVIAVHAEDLVCYMGPRPLEILTDNAFHPALRQ